MLLTQCLIIEQRSSFQLSLQHHYKKNTAEIPSVKGQRLHPLEKLKQTNADVNDAREEHEIGGATAAVEEYILRGWAAVSAKTR